MSNIIDKIRLSGTDYTLSATTSGVSVIEVTQAEYDALPSSAKTDTSKMYVITDAQAGDLTQYWTSAQTNSAITQAVSGKQDTLVSGTNIKTINNTSILGSGNIDIQGGGGGKTIEAGRGIAITTGETADTVSFDLDIYNHTGSTISSNIEIFGHPYADKGISTNKIKNNSMHEFIVGTDNRISGSGKVTYGTIIGENNKIISDGDTRPAYIFGAENVLSGINLGGSTLIGEYNSGYTYYEFAAGYANECKNQAEVALGKYNVSSLATTSMEFGDSGNTLFSVGNGTSNSARHNAFEIRQNGDIYLSSGGTDIKLQDHLGGGGGGGMTEDDELLLSTALTDLNDRKADKSEVKDYLEEYQKKGDYVTTSTLNTRLADYETALDEQNVEEVTAYALNDLNERFGGLRIVKITESEYAALTTKDENTLYVVIADPT